MGTNLEKYRLAKNTLAELETVARKELIAEYHALQARLIDLKQELREFGVKTIPQAPLKKRAQRSKVDPEAPRKTVSPQSAKRIKAIETKLNKAKARAASASNPADGKRYGDQVYELEDTLRLEREKA